MLTHKATAAHKLTRRELIEQARAPEMRRTVERSSFKASMVFREICSYIKGSSEALDEQHGYLSKEKYLGLGRKIAPSFEKVSAEDDHESGRGKVYELFRQYEEWKAAFEAYDVMDAVFHIYAELKRKGYQGDPIHEIYVDEVRLMGSVSRESGRATFA
eukprot:6659469-Prymnesium_polylepis.2